MASSTNTKLTISQMVDLSLNAPEVGVVNFTILHSLLHVIVNKLELGDCLVEFRDKQSERLQTYISTTNLAPTITLTEYTVGPGGKGRKKKVKEKDEKGKADEKETEKSGSNDTVQTLVVIEPVGTNASAQTPQCSIAVTKDYIDKIENDISDLQTQVKELIELPGNIGLIEALRTEGKQRPVLDMFQNLMQVKRLDAVELSLAKLGSMMEDLAKEQITANVQGTGKKGSDELRSKVSIIKAPPSSKDIKARPSETATKTIPSKPSSMVVSKDDKSVKKQVTSTPSTATTKPVEKIVTKKDDKAGQQQAAPKKEEKTTKPVSPKESKLSRSLRDSKSKEDKSAVEMQSGEEDEPKKEFVTEIQEGKPTASEMVEVDTAGEQLVLASSTEELSPGEEPKITKTIVPQSQKPKSPKAGVHDDITTNLDQQEVIQKIREDIKEIKETLTKENYAQIARDVDRLKNLLSSQMSSIQQQKPSGIITDQPHFAKDDMDRIEKRVAVLEQDLQILRDTSRNTVAGSAVTVDQLTSHNELYAKMVNLQDKVNDLTHTATTLWEEKENSKESVKLLSDQIDNLRAGKANRVEMEEALTEKADVCMVNRKVSFVQLDKVCEEMTNHIEESLERLKDQEKIWTKTLDEMNDVIGNKLDRLELLPLQDFINNKLKVLHEKLRSLAVLKKEHEAAGTRRKLLKDLNCISCDSTVVTRSGVDISMYPKKPGSIPPRNMGPYLAYELDQLRKQQKCFPQSKNMNALTTALTKPKSAGPGITESHVCNRYCGGSHTQLAPQQRVARVGHFIDQWGAEAVPSQEVRVKGLDGKFYKAQPLGSTEKPSEKSVKISLKIEKSPSDTSQTTSATDRTHKANKPVGSKTGEIEAEAFENIESTHSPKASNTSNTAQQNNENYPPFQTSTPKKATPKKDPSKIISEKQSSTTEKSSKVTVEEAEIFEETSEANLKKEK